MNIEGCTKIIYEKFNEIRGKGKDEIKFRFWDVVVLTAADEEQKTAYELQLEHKLKCKEIPVGLDYHVFADPPGPKIGCGGATMHVISKLNELYGSNLDNLYILLINAGGQSQRLPSASVLGKIFTALPFGNPVWQLLELKLACYIPFLSRMNPGYFHAASDTLEVYEIDEQDDEDRWNFRRSGLTALAHPSSLKIGTTHGVFILEGTEKPMKLAEFQKCLQVLQKPSIDEIRKKDAIFKRIETNEGLEEFVYTDSCFYFDHEFARKLHKFYMEEKPLKCEIDGYGDFMQSLGPNATTEFATDFKNVSTVDPTLESSRKKLFSYLHGTPINVITLDASKFYHIGTMQEYLENLNIDSELSNYVGWKTNTFCKVFENQRLNDKSCSISCHFGSSIEMGSACVIEYCQFLCSVKIGSNSIISNCFCGDKESDFILNIPSNVFLHTIPVRFKSADDDKSEMWYVTLVFSVDDDLKKRQKDVDDLIYLGKPLSKTYSDQNDLFDEHSTSVPIFSLWFARLFPAMKCMETSLLASLEIATGNKSFERKNVPRWFSAHDAVQSKDVKGMLAYRDSLNNEIKSNRPA